MTGILMLESLTRGNTLKQGDKTPLTYKLLDADGDNLSIAGKTATVRLVHPNYLTIGYEKTGLTVQSDDTVTFTIDKIVPARKYHVEIIVDNKFVFPSRSAESKFTIDKSSLATETNIIKIIGKDVLIREVKSQVDTELQPLVTSLQDAQQAEVQRASEESARVSAEEQREIDHANRSAELDGKADKVVLKNLIKNGDFSDGVTGWLTNFGSLSAIQNVASFTISEPNLTNRIYQTGFSVPNDIFYVTTKIKRTSGGKTNLLMIGGAETKTLSDSVAGQYVTYKLREKLKDTSSLSIYFRDTVAGEVINIKETLAINLTKTFGAGNEPTKEEMDELIKVTGYIDGEYALNNKEMLGHLMKGIHEKANKKQEDWITPTLLNGFTGDVRYRKTQFGHLEISGTVTSTEPIDSKMLQIFSLPSGYRPARDVKFEAPENAFYTFRNARMATTTFERALMILAGQGGSKWEINVTIPID